MTQTEFEDKAQQIVECMGWDLNSLTFHEYGYDAEVKVQVDGVDELLTVKIYVDSSNREKNRVIIYGGYPRYKTHDGMYAQPHYETYRSNTPVSIGVSFNREAKAIAGDIRRRFIPEWHQDVQKALAVIEQDENATAALAARRQSLVSPMLKSPLTVRPSVHVHLFESNDPTSRVNFFTCGSGGKLTTPVSIDVTLNSDDVNIKMHWIPDDLAEKLMKIIADYNWNTRGK